MTTVTFGNAQRWYPGADHPAGPGISLDRKPKALSGGQRRRVAVDSAAAAKMQGDITVGVRPEASRVVGNGEVGLLVRVTVVEDLGSDAYLYGSCGVEGTPNNLIIRVSRRKSSSAWETMYVTTDPRHVHVFETESGDRLSE